MNLQDLFQFRVVVKAAGNPEQVIEIGNYQRPLETTLMLEQKDRIMVRDYNLFHLIEPED